jgi:hypothetical protein
MHFIYVIFSTGEIYSCLYDYNQNGEFNFFTRDINGWHIVKPGTKGGSRKKRKQKIKKTKRKYYKYLRN